MLHSMRTSCLTLLSLVLVGQPVQAFEDFQTTRLKSTSGTGVGSILMDEATVLNPAPLAFYGVSSIYFQRSGGDFEPSAVDASPLEGESTAFIASDSKGSLGGSLSYIQQKQGGDSRKRYGISLSSNLGERSAFGVNYRITKTQTLSEGLTPLERTDKQTIFGITHAISSELTLGMVAIDPFRVVPEETRGLIGLQYVFNDFISVMLDAGADYNETLSETAILRGAMQFKIYQDFFLRFGMHEDKGLQEKGNGIGVGWVQPRLVLDLALRNTTREFEASGVRDAYSQDLRETSFSASYRF